MGNPGATLSAYRDMQSQARSILEAAKHGPLQSLTDREMDIRGQPLTIYPHPLQRRVKAWVRFGPEAVRVDAKLVRSTPLAAGIEFRAEDQTFRCWVWGNAVTLADVDGPA
ncbi:MULTISPECIES: hypothetical protein [unclassified Microbacterium]|uniref:hypothetical protein n=1 Tax=unclassified Microbacterium TaxID=2609290 RepID=UPI001FCED210|nr:MULTISPECIES: hypothetical protein [unclassified Microbacterium]